jgi:hypothetical protein
VIYELADYLGAGGALLLGLLIGRKMRPKPPEPIKPICSCNHGYGSHVDGKRCQAQALVQYDAYKSNKELQPCPCVRYDGPDPAVFGLGVMP